MKRCRSASTNDEKAKHYIDVLLSSVEYETFVKLMKIMRPVAEMRASAAKTASTSKLEGKGGGGGTENSPAKSSKDIGFDRAETKGVVGDEPAPVADVKSSSAPREDKLGNK